MVVIVPVRKLGDREHLKRRRGRITESMRLPWWTLERMVVRKEQLKEQRERRISGCGGGDRVRCRAEESSGLQGEKESDKVAVGHSKQGIRKC